MTPVYYAAPLPERELPAYEIIAPELRGAFSCFLFEYPGFAYTAYEIAGTDRFVIRADSGGAFPALVAFSQYLYEHPERRRAALIVIGGGEMTEGLVNAFIELFPDFPLLLPSGSPEGLRLYAVRRAGLKGVTLLLPGGATGRECREGPAR